MHHLFVASAKAVELGHSINPDFQIGMMVAYIPSYPLSCKPEDVMAAVQFNREQEFYMDVQAKGYYPAHKLKEFEREGMTIQMESEDLAIIQKEQLIISGLVIICRPFRLLIPKK